MVKKKRISRYLHKNWESIVDNLKVLHKENNGDALHDLRVSTKKIKAIVHLLQYILQNNKAFSVKKLKPLFRQAGVIRTAELNMKMLNEYKIDIPCLEKKELNDPDKDYEALRNEKKTYQKNIKKLKRKFDKALGPLKNNKVKTYYFNQLNQLSMYFTYPDKEQLHDNRKIIKNIMYSIEVMPKSLQKEINLNKEYLDTLQDDIGKWHDFIIVKEWLADFDLQNDQGFATLNLKENQLLKNIQNEVEDFENKAISGHGKEEYVMLFNIHNYFLTA